MDNNTIANYQHSISYFNSAVPRDSVWSGANWMSTESQRMAYVAEPAINLLFIFLFGCSDWWKKRRRMVISQGWPIHLLVPQNPVSQQEGHFFLLAMSPIQKLCEIASYMAAESSSQCPRWKLPGVKIIPPNLLNTRHFEDTYAISWQSNTAGGFSSGVGEKTALSRLEHQMKCLAWL